MLYSQNSMVGWPQAWMSMQDPLGALTRQPSTIYPPLSAVTSLPVSFHILNTFLNMHKIYHPLLMIELH
jgi:hypothetical protein